MVRYDLIDASHRPPDLGRVPGVVPGCCPASPIGETPGGGLGACPGDQSRGGSDGISGRDFSAVPTEVPSGGDPVGGRLASGGADGRASGLCRGQAHDTAQVPQRLRMRGQPGQLQPGWRIRADQPVQCHVRPLLIEAVTAGADQPRDQRNQPLPSFVREAVVAPVTERDQHRGNAAGCGGVRFVGKPGDRLHEAQTIVTLLMVAEAEDEGVQVEVMHRSDLPGLARCCHQGSVHDPAKADTDSFADRCRRPRPGNDRCAPPRRPPLSCLIRPGPSPTR